MKFSKYFLILLCLVGSLAHAQDAQVFTQEQLLWYVKNFHPVAKKADLQLRMGDGTVRAARGAFDPKIYGNLNNKSFESTEYFNMVGVGLAIPTWYGVEIKTGYDRNNGVFLNPENYLPEGGLWFGGISVPVGQGLFIDKRRASLKQAKLFAQATEAERQSMLNNLYFAAISEYWNWVQAWNQYQVYEDAVVLAEIRFDAVKKSFAFGDVPAIDTLEANIQLQNRLLKRNEYRVKYRNQILKLSNYLWFENNTPLVLTDSAEAPSMSSVVIGDKFTNDTLQHIVSSLTSSHPELVGMDFKIASLKVERRLKVENLKPRLNLNYNLLNEPIGNDVVAGLTPNNYKWGIDFGIPIFLRKQRGELQQTAVKIQENELGRRQKSRELSNKLTAYYNEHVNLVDQVGLYSQAVTNYENLLLGEKRKFQAGESSLFLVNSRETGFIQAQLKLMELTSQANIARAGVLWASGQLSNE